MEQLRWLPEVDKWRDRLAALRAADMADVWPTAVALANSRMNFVKSNSLDETVRALLPACDVQLATKPVRLAILGTSTLAHLHAGIRVAGLRRNILIETYENAYGQYLQELLEPSSTLYAFEPSAVLIALDSSHLTQGLHAGLHADDVEAIFVEVLSRIEQCWSLARSAFGCQILHQASLDTFPTLLGGNEHRLPGSRSRFICRLNEAVRLSADRHGVDIVAVDEAAQQDGLSTWHDISLWHRSKQEITPALSPTYGELVGRQIAARQGRSYKCLVLDLDNTLWGGVIGDDGLDGIVIGQGSALGEGFAAVQEYAKELARRGIILAVSSKNDEANALEVFDKHPEMILRRSDIAVFRVNWEDKVANIRAIAEDLNIGLDALVFLDDNPFERNFVREQLPMVAVPEVPDDEPALVPNVLADAGYFESLKITQDDLERSTQYQENRARAGLRATSGDLQDFLRALEMRMVWSRFDHVGQSRITQLVNKTNQFNLTTRRHNEAYIEKIISDISSFGLQMRLLDRFGDNGIIAIIIGRTTEPGTVTIDTWLMSCRVLGRGVERAILNLVVEQALALGATRLVGEYIPTKKNGMVRDHYKNLGFSLLHAAPDGTSLFSLSLASFVPHPSFINVVEAR